MSYSAVFTCLFFCVRVMFHPDPPPKLSFVSATGTVPLYRNFDLFLWGVEKSESELVLIYEGCSKSKFPYFLSFF